ncbi:TadE/TadG family type IV pilus assembly protein [Aeromicrobium sp. Root495]|uniref:TadE/TadG family type IV pilus assembly protein n=1 Tax=Aeromicrobium sp. Root495 TaxID=1736550 RepID=UPI0009E69DED|nr:TadE/TadG family type IV pilus assembly protein [Aeromicrobium sp. Root495]
MNARTERGSYSLELAICSVLAIMFVLLIVGLGRMSLASQRVTAAAFEAARSASLERDDAAAGEAGRTAARKSIADRGLSCAQLTVQINTTNERPGGAVRARVTCVARLSDLALSGLPGSKTYVADATVPIEQYRADG